LPTVARWWHDSIVRRSLPCFFTLVTLQACRVYDPALLQSDAAQTDSMLADGTVQDVRSDAADTGIDVTDVTSPEAGREGGADITDVMLTGCDGVLARREACIEPVAGEGFTAQTPELVAPDALVIHSESPLVAYVGDSATGRVMEVREAPGGLRVTLVAGMDVTAPLGSAGLAQERPLGAISGMSLQSGGGATLIGADPRGHVAFRLDVQQAALATSSIERVALTTTGPATGPYDIEQAFGALAFTANNTLFLATGAGANTLAGTSCTALAGCEGFNAAPALPGASVFATPGAIEVNRSGMSNIAYVADSNNCRVRRYVNPTTNVDTIVGSGCSNVGTVHDGMAAPVAASSVRLGALGSMALARSRFLFVADPNARCSLFVVDLQAAPAPTIRLVAGHGALCGENARSGGDYRLGRLGGVAIGPVTQSAYFVDAQSRSLYRADVSPTGVPGSVVLVGSLGPRRGSESIANFRSGGFRGLAAIAPAASASALPEIVWGAPFESRVFGLRDRAIRVASGAGSSPPTAAIAITQMEPTVVEAIAALPNPTVRTDALIAARDRHVVLRLSGESMTLAAGAYGVRGNAGAAGMLDAIRLDDPTAIAIANTNTAYVASRRANGNYLVYLLNFATRTFSTLIGPPPTDAAPGDTLMVGAGIAANRVRLLAVSAIAYNTARDEIYLADPEQNAIIRVARSMAGPLEATVLAGNLTENVAAVEDDMRVDGQPATNVPIANPSALALDDTGNTLYIADAATHRVYAVDLTAATPTIRRIAGSGPAQPAIPLSTGNGAAARSARLSAPSALAYVPSMGNGAALLVGESGSGRLRIVRFPR
jgi:hypothetical protein